MLSQRNHIPSPPYANVASLNNDKYIKILCEHFPLSFLEKKEVRSLLVLLPGIYVMSGILVSVLYHKDTCYSKDFRAEKWKKLGSLMILRSCYYASSIQALVIWVFLYNIVLQKLFSTFLKYLLFHLYLFKSLWIHRSLQMHFIPSSKSVHK